MNWRDLLYFSKGERRALTVLLCLITTSWILLLLTDEKPIPVAAAPDAYRQIPPSASDKPPVNTGQTLPEVKNKFTRKETEKSNTESHREKKREGAYKAYPRTEKYPEGTRVELNTADTTSLKKVPGIGSSFARRIVKYRELLGGFYTVSQLGEVYGIDEERYTALAPWFTANAAYIRQLTVNRLPADSLARHPYISYRQARAIGQLRKQKSRLSGWENLLLIEELTETDRMRLTPYLSFE